VPLQDVAAKINAAQAAGDWRGVLKWEGRMEELMAGEPDNSCSKILRAFSWAHQMGSQATGLNDHAHSYVGLLERWIPLLGKLQHFRQQGKTMCSLSTILRVLERNSEAATWHQRARDVGAAHGLFSLECSACIELGGAAIEEGRHEEGLALLRNALVAAELNELDDPKYELGALEALFEALLHPHAIEEVEPLVLRYRDAAKAQSEKEGVCFAEFNALHYSARLHEVLCFSTLSLGTPFHYSALASWTAISRLTVTGSIAPETHAPVEPCALCRHAGSLKRPRGRCALCST
jgi:hypothetical protein